LIERWIYLRLVPSAAIERIYRRLYRLGRPLAGEHTPAETAYEFNEKLVRRMDVVKKGSRLKKFFSHAQHDIELLSKIYQDALFRESYVQKKDVRRALNIWRNLRMKFVLARLYIITRRRQNLN
jgi:hypothetical protein